MLEVLSLKQQLFLNMCNLDSPFLCLSETWLSHNVLNHELVPNYYSVYRSDRNFAACGKSRGGGVLFAHKEFLSCRRILLDAYNFPPEADVVCVSTTCLSRNITFVVVYIPPDVHLTIYEEFMDSLSLLHTNIGGHILIAGDFNSCQFPKPCKGRSRLLTNFVESSGLQQQNAVLNSFNRSLDLVFSSLSCRVSRSDFSLVAENPHHPTLFIDMKVPPHYPRCATNTSKVTFNYKKTDFPNLYAAISSIDWSILSSVREANSMCDIFYFTLMETIKAHVPVFKPKRNPVPSWYTPDIIYLIKRKDRARRLYCKTRSNNTYSNFSSLRAQDKSLLTATYKNFIKSSED